MKTKKTEFQQSILQAHAALKRGEKTEARHWAMRAAALDPASEKPWLLLGLTGTPKANLAYFAEALARNPHSSFAKKGIRQLIAEGNDDRAVSLDAARHHLVKARARRQQKARQKMIATFTGFILSITAGTLALALLGGAMPLNTNGLAYSEPTQTAAAVPTATATAYFPVQAAQTQSAYTPVPTYTPVPSATPTATATNTPSPTLTALQIYMPMEVEGNEYWVDVDLTNQTLTAYKGEEAVRTFIVSTGTWQYPTVTGKYQVYVKYESASMSGPGYYLPGVPYIMYFYRGYGLHGTYWHNNFGTPMSHGCVNLRTEDAEWLFGVMEVGSWVNVHY